MAHVLAGLTSSPRALASKANGSAPRLDTIALVERGTERGGREISTTLALVLIVLLSLVAAMATYLIRVR